MAIATFTQLLAFTVMGERLTTRLRDLAFRNIVRQVGLRVCVGVWVWVGGYMHDEDARRALALLYVRVCR